MGFNDHGNEHLQLAYEDLIDEGLIDESSDEAGVARQVINRGLKSLTPKQMYTYRTLFEPVLERRARQLEEQRMMQADPDSP